MSAKPDLKTLSTAALYAICEQHMDKLAEQYPDAISHISEYIGRIDAANVALRRTIIILQADALK